MSRTRKAFLITLTLIILTVVICVAYIFLSPYGVSSIDEAERVYRVAIQNNDISICDKVHLTVMSDSEPVTIKMGCYKEYVLAHPDQNVCPRIGNTDQCVSALADASGNASECLVINDGYRALCVAYVAIEKNDVDICNTLNDAVLETQCRGFFKAKPVTPIQLQKEFNSVGL